MCRNDQYLCKLVATIRPSILASPYNLSMEKLVRSSDGNGCWLEPRTDAPQNDPEYSAVRNLDPDGVLYQGMASAVPQTQQKNAGLQPLRSVLPEIPGCYALCIDREAVYRSVSILRGHHGPASVEWMQPD
jgi:hypothetical protein